MEKQYLSLEEQFKKSLNNTEITQIEDYELREIRQNHWNYRHKILFGIDERKFYYEKVGRRSNNRKCLRINQRK